MYRLAEAATIRDTAGGRAVVRHRLCRGGAWGFDLLRTQIAGLYAKCTKSSRPGTSGSFLES